MHSWLIWEDLLHPAEAAPNQTALSALKFSNDLKLANEET